MKLQKANLFAILHDMRTVTASMKMLYWLMTAGWVIMAPLCVVFVFQGGWLVAIGYYYYWDQLRDMSKGLSEVNKQNTNESEPRTTGEAVDQLLAQGTRSIHTDYRYLGGAENIGGPAGFADAGYRYSDVTTYTPQAICPTCNARYSRDPYRGFLRRCKFCASDLIQLESPPRA